MFIQIIGDLTPTWSEGFSDATGPLGANVDLMINASAALLLTWLAMALFVYWRRKTTNLTPVDVPSAKKNAQPDFLSVDKKARKAAMKRGDKYARELDRRERLEGVDFQQSRMLRASRVCGFIALTLCVVTLGTIVAGSIWPDSFVGQLLSHYSTEGRVTEVLRAHPVPLVIAMLSVGWCVVRLAMTKRPRTVAS